jgi:hypothetical protein
VAGAGFCVVVSAGPASAAPDDGLLRIAHLSPDSPAVDVALAPVRGEAPLTDPGPDLVADLDYGGVSDFTALAPGRYAVSIRAAGAPATTPPALSARVDVPAGGARTVTISGLFTDLSLRTLPDDLAPPPEDAARVRVLAAAAGVDSLDVELAGGPVLAEDLAFTEAAAPVVVPSAAARVHVDGGPGLRAVLPTDLAAGSVVTLLVLDAVDGGLTVRVVLDAAGTARTPTGGVEAGAGGTAGGSPWPAGAALAALGVGLAATSRRGRVLLVVATAAATTAVTVPGGAPAATASSPEPSITLAAPTAADPAAPVRLRAPSVGIDTALTDVDVDRTGALVPPADDAVAGWYRQGPAPGAPGPAVLTGHVDGPDGPAVFFRLRDLAVGDPVLVERADGTTARFTVSSVARHPKDAFPTASVYGPVPDAELRLITCGGSFDRTLGSYRDNVVVSARLG